MPVLLFLAPPAGGKTAYLIDLARGQAADLAASPRVVVSTQLQVRSWKRRLAERGGSLGVRVGTFAALYGEILRAAGQVYTRLTEPIQYRLLRALVAEAPLVHFSPLRNSPGFVQMLLGLIGELKAGGVFPQDLAEAVQGMGGEPRLMEMADLYLAYQEQLRRRGWADAAGIGWLAAEVLSHHPQVGREWPCLMVDGFDDLTTVQIRVLRELAGRVGQLVITLSGQVEGAPSPRAYRRFDRTRRLLEKELRVVAQPLPALPEMRSRASALAHLQAHLFGSEPARYAPDGSVTLIAAPDREGEVRAALRWLKERLVYESVLPGEAALLARQVDVYRPLIQQVAAEFGIPIHVTGGMPLRHNPAVAAFLDLLRAAVPGDGAFPWRLTVEAWRSPYFDWMRCVLPGDKVPVGIALQDAEVLDWIARWASVVGGVEQWDEAFELLTEAGPREDLDEDVPQLPDLLPTGTAAPTLQEKFERFVRRVTPPQGPLPCRAYVSWLEGLIGDADLQGGVATADLGVMRQILNAPPELAERDLLAMNAFKDVLRGLVWAEEALGCAPMTFAGFLGELVGAVNAAVFRLPMPATGDAVLVADVLEARGVPFRAVAVLGLAEGEFPVALSEDPLLRDADRLALRERFGLEVDLSTVSAEDGYLSEGITRARDALLLTRPRIADNGAPWQASPYWEEVLRWVDAVPALLTGGSYPSPQGAASWQELLLGVCARSDDVALWEWALRQDAARCSRLDAAAGILTHRAGPADDSTGAHDGHLGAWGGTFARRFGASHIWSASRLEAFRSCPFRFFVGSVLQLEPRVRPSEGLDARQLGNVYHRIFEHLYQSVQDPTDLEQLLGALPEAARAILDEAPRRERFRATAWWAQTRQEIVEDVRQSLVALSLLALDALDDDYVPTAHELPFGMAGGSGEALVVQDIERGDLFCLHGFVDRVDRASDGRLRVVDYKTGGPWSYDRAAVESGKKLQLALYALAVERSLRLGEVADGFYWHVRHAGWHLAHAQSRSWFTLARSGTREILDRALGYAWEAVRGARAGYFVPKPPEDGCPAYCPASPFCWRYAPRAW